MKNIYDDSHFFDYYKNLRKEKINANNLLENPNMFELMPDVKGLTILDLGCGDGNMSKNFIKMGAKKVVGIDLSVNMINQAKLENNDENIEYYVMGMEDISNIKEKFDLVYSSLAFHYIEDFDKLIKDIYNLLNPKGMLLYSQESPLTTCLVYTQNNTENKIYIEDKRYYIISDYCNEGERTKIWSDTPVTKYHRTYASIVNTFIENNFKIIKVQDSYASKEAIELCDKYKYQKDKPMFTYFKVEKI